MHIVDALTIIETHVGHDTSALHSSVGLCEEPAPGFLRQVRLGPAGVLIIAPNGTREGASVFIPTGVILAAAEAANPALKAPQA